MEILTILARLTLAAMFFAGLVLLYFLPTLLASKNRKPNVNSIFVLNFFLGWTWVIALMMAVSTADYQEGRR